MRGWLIYIFSLLWVTTFSQSETIEIQWKPNPVLENIKTNPFPIIFENMGIDGTHPIYVHQEKNSGKFTLESFEGELLSQEEKKYFESDIFSTLPRFRSFSTKSHGNSICGFELVPFYIKENQLYKVTKFTVQKTVLDNFELRSTNSLQDSKLSIGKWHQLIITKDGAYKITFQNLKDWGIISSNIPTSQIQLSGNKGAMLPLINQDARPIDLQNIPTVYVDGGDGIFNQGDYLLFYGTAGGEISYNTAKNTFVKTQNIFSDTNYIYIAVDGIAQTMAEDINDGPGVYSTYSYTPYFHELEKVNFIESGRNWVGEEMIGGSKLEYKFPVKNLYNNTLNFNFYGQFCARSFDYPKNTFAIVINGDTLSKRQISTVSTVYYNDYVKFSSTAFQEDLVGDTLNLEICYLNNSVSTGWLDFFHLNIEEPNYFDGGQQLYTPFHLPGVYYYHTFKSEITPRVWDITSFNEVKQLAVTTTDTGFYFSKALDTLRNFIIFEDNAALTPVYNKAITNQNLHRELGKNYIVIHHPKFAQQAKEIADFHAVQDGFSVAYYSTESIYHEFSSGRHEATAIRDFIRHLYQNPASPDDSVHYVLLIGDGSFDHKNLTEGNHNFLPTFQSSNSTKLTSSYVTDDIFGLMDDLEGDYLNGDKLDIGVGRFPVSTTFQADQIIKKIKEYYNQYDLSNTVNEFERDLLNSNGSWQNNILFVADDEDFNEHMKQSHILATFIEDSVKELNVRRLFIDAFPQEHLISGTLSPKAASTLQENLHEGVLIVNYTGHGGELGWAEESILLNQDILAMTNRHRLPLFMTATCEFSRFDEPHIISAGEHLILKESGGAIALFTTVRLVFSIPNFQLNKTLYTVFQDLKNSQEQIFLGDLFRTTKVVNNGGSNDRNFTLLGDPGLKLAFTPKRVTTSQISIGAQTTDTIRALDEITVKGHINNISGQPLSNFNGTIEIKLFDKSLDRQTLNNDNGTPFDYHQQEIELSRTQHQVINGDFEATFPIPKDVMAQYGIGKISYYAVSDSGITAAGWDTSFVLGGINPNVVLDEKGPQIELFLQDTSFVFGDIVAPEPLLIVYLSDSNGINTNPSDIGKDILLIIDENSSQSIVLNKVYSSNVSDYTNGQIIYQLETADNGRHSLVLKAYDNHNNLGQGYTEFIIEETPELALEHVLNYPNPFTTSTGFYFEHNQSAGNLDVSIQIYTVSGKLIRTLQTSTSTGNTRVGPIEWDGTDDYGDRIGRGTYIYKVSVRKENGEVETVLQKLVILR